MAVQLSTEREEPAMAASEMAYGEDHPATQTQQPPPTHRPAQLSGEAHGDGEDHGFLAGIPPQSHSFHHGHDCDD